MRLGYVLNNFSPLSETFIRREVLALCDAGDRVFVYANHLHAEPLVPEPRHANLTVRHVAFRSEPGHLVEAAGYDRVAHLHGSLMLDAQLAAFAAARALSIPFSITAYSGHTVFTAQPLLYRELSRHRLCGGVVVEDPFMRDWVVERLGADPAKVEQIPNSLDLGDYRLSAPRPAHTPLRILSIARFTPKKGLIHLAEAFLRLAPPVPVELWLIGSGEEEPALRQQAAGSKAIHFLGSQPEAKCREAYQESDIFCLPCVRAQDGDADGIPTTVLEAMAFELPVVVSDLLSAPYYVRHEREGLLARPGDTEGVADCLLRLCRDEALRRSMGQLGRQRVEELNDLRKNVSKLQALFRRTYAPAPQPEPEARPLVSVAITAHNRAQFLAGCIESVLSQTYGPIECVVVDDGSTDGTSGILARYAGRIRVVRNLHNQGVAAAKNQALRMTSGTARYVALLDSDDHFHPEFVERCVTCLERNLEAGVAYVNEVLVDESGRELWRRTDEGPWSTDEWLRTRHLRGDCWLARRELVMRTELHDESMPMDVDYDLFYQLLELGSFYHLPEPLLYLRSHRSQLTRDLMTVARCHAANLVKYGYSPEYAFLRARRNPEWVPAIEEGVTLGKRMRAAREKRRRRAAQSDNTEALAVEGGKPEREEFLPFGVPCVGQEEIDEVTAALRSGWIGTGPRVARFELEFAEYVGATHAIALNSCTAGLFLSLITLGIGPGDEVITTPLTFAATANVIEQVGARPVFADIDAETLNIDPRSVERAITPRTRAILAVHFGGLPCDLEGLRAVAEPRGIAIVEDAAHAVGARYQGRMVGSGPNVAVFSFYGNKNLTTAEGGMITTPDRAQADRIRVLRMHGLASGAWEHFADRGMAPAELVAAGYKFNMPDFAAALGLPQLRKQEALLSMRQRHARRYDQALRGLPLLRQWRPAEDPADRHSLHLYVVRLMQGRWKVPRDRVVEALRAENIGATVHYPALHLARFYRVKYGFVEGSLPIAEEVAKSILTLPLSPAMTNWDADDVIEAVSKIAACYAAS